MAETITYNPNVPPWEREYMAWREVPAYVMHKWGVSVQPCTVQNWIYKGKPDMASPTGKRWLRTTKVLSKTIVSVKDLEDFVAKTGGERR